LRERAKRGTVVHRDVGEHLAIDLHAGLAKAVDDAAVGQTVQPRRGIDARDPQGAELALVLPAIAVGILPGLDDGLLGGAVNLAAGVVVALRLAKNLLVTAPGRHATLNSCHGAARLTVMGQKLLETTDVGLVHEAGAPGAGVALELAGLVTEI